jgi:hypothetical protein
MSVATLAGASRRTTRAMLAAGALGAGWYLVTVLAMHAIQPEIHPLDQRGGFPSEYAIGRWGWLMGLAFAGFGVGVLAFAAGLHRSLARSGRATAAAACLAVSGLGLIGAGIFTGDPPRPDGTVGYTVSGQLHALAGLLSFLGLIVGLFLVRGVFARDPARRPLARLTRWVAWGTLAGLVAEIVAGSAGTAPGLVGRIFLPLPLIWLVIVVSRLRGTPDQPAGPVFLPSTPAQEKT